MIIRKEQMDALRRYMARRFEDDMVERLCSRFSESADME